MNINAVSITLFLVLLLQTHADLAVFREAFVMLSMNVADYLRATESEGNFIQVRVSA